VGDGLTARSPEPARQYVYRASPNGEFVGVGPTRAKRNSTTTMYTAYDVTKLLRRGEDNALGVLAYTTTDKRFQAQLVIEYADATRDVIASDGDWRTVPGQIAMPSGGDIGTQYYDAPVEHWKATGDSSSAAAYYDKLVTFLPTSRIDSTGLVNWSSGDHLVDWPGGERDGFVFTNYNTVINAWSYRAFADMAELAAALGKDADAARWEGIATRLKAAINERLFDASAGAYNDGLATTHKAVHSSVFAVSFGVAGPEQIGPAANYIATRGMVCSVFCANFLIDALYKAGRAEDAIRLLTATNDRSWLGMIAQGAGSPMEAWAPRYKSNATFSHPWAGSPAYLVYRGTLGIEALEPAFKRFQVKPQPVG
jgi:hypothetical protein